MADRYINLKELLPLYLQAYKELAAPMDAGNTGVPDN